jgi:hypothetical protein
MTSRIIQAEVNVICRSEAESIDVIRLGQCYPPSLRQITLTSV